MPRWPSKMWTWSLGCWMRRTRGRPGRGTGGNGGRADACARPVRRTLARPGGPAGGDRNRRPPPGSSPSGTKCRRWCSTTSCRVEPGQVAAAAPRVPAHRVRAVDQSAEAQLGAEGRVVEVAPQLDRHPMLQVRAIASVRERWAPDHVGQQVERQRQVLGADADRARRSPRPRASRRRPRWPVRSPSASRDVVPSSSSRPVRAARPGLASRSDPGVDIQLERDDPREPAAARRPAASHSPAPSAADGNRPAARQPAGTETDSSRSAAPASPRRRRCGRPVWPSAARRTLCPGRWPRCRPLRQERNAGRLQPAVRPGSSR